MSEPIVVMNINVPPMSINHSIVLYILCMKCTKPSYAFALAMHIKAINKTKQNKTSTDSEFSNFLHIISLLVFYLA